MANNQQVRVDLQFKGDISDVEKKLQQLQNTLSGITSGKAIKDMAFTSDINKAVGDATKLQAILKNTTMANGNLDLTKFRSELQKSGMTVKELGNSLLSLGPQGSQAFSQLTQSIMSAEVPLKRTSTLLSNFATTLKNTAKWQISSSILHGFMSSVSSAYNYAQDLNESLNNIRIVSKQNTDQMAEFAQEANKAAKELSVTTTAYTDAALIFYQQGLEGDAVTERTDVVAKMSNVTRDSVDEVSSYMTAIWNNFDDGSQSLEHYADVITGLGAATASSSAEIAQGLEKFAAVADTVGLSYDYATSALATVVAQTRQSADTVGTAFKTLFARIEGLKLGETLEDGVDLNKYSEALAKIGVSVLDANGQLRDMDSILDDMGAKWGQINKAQQIALAQTVAGTRQYNQLVALMDNWDKVQDNLQIARSSDGELQAQADIYAESWEAAQKRVRAAWESIYSSLFDDKFFIKLTNGLGSFIEGIDKVVKSLGGLKGILPLLSVGLLNLFNKDIANGINNFVYNLQIGTKKAQNELIDFKQQLKNIFDDMTSDGSLSSGASIDALKGMATIQEANLNRQRQLNELGIEENETQKLLNQYGMKRIEQLGQEMTLKAQAVELAEKEAQEAEKKLQRSLNTNLNQGSFITEGQKQSLLNVPNITDEDKEKYQSYITQEEVQRVLDLSKAYAQANDLIERFIKISNEQGDTAAIEWINKDIKNLEEFNVLLESSEQEVVDLKTTLIEGFQKSVGIENTIEQEQIYNNLLDQTEDLALEAEDEYVKLTGRIEENTESTKSEKKAIDDLNNAIQTNIKLGREREEHSHSFLNFNSGVKAEKERLENDSKVSQLQPLDYGKTFTDATRSIVSFGTALNSLSGMFKTLADEEASFGDKLLSVLTSGGMAITMLGSSAKGLIGAFTPLVKNVEVLTTLNKVTTTDLQEQIALMMEQGAIKNGQILLDKIKLGNEAVYTKEEATQLSLIAIKTGLESGEIGILSAIVALSKLETTEAEKQVVLQKIKAKLQGKLNFKNIFSGLENIGSSLTSIVGTLGTAGVVLGVVVAAVAAAVIAYKAYRNHLKAVAEEATNAAKKEQEKLQTIKEETQAIDDLTTKYAELNAQLSDLGEENARAEMFKMAVQAGQTDLAVKALASSFKTFGNILDEVAQEQNKLYQDQAKTTVEASQNAVYANLRTVKEKYTDNFGETIDIGKGHWGGQNREFNEQLQTQFGLVVDNTGHIKTEDFIKVLTTDQEKFINFINSSSSANAKNLQEIYGEIKDSAEMLKEAGAAYSDSVEKTLVSSKKKSIAEIKTLKEYEGIKSELIQSASETELFEYKGIDSLEEQNNWARDLILKQDALNDRLEKQLYLQDQITEKQRVSHTEYEDVNLTDYFHNGGKISEIEAGKLGSGLWQQISNETGLNRGLLTNYLMAGIESVPAEAQEAVDKALALIEAQKPAEATTFSIEVEISTELPEEEKKNLQEKIDELTDDELNYVTLNIDRFSSVEDLEKILNGDFKKRIEAFNQKEGIITLSTAVEDLDLSKKKNTGFDSEQVHGFFNYNDKINGLNEGQFAGLETSQQLYNIMQGVDEMAANYAEHRKAAKEEAEQELNVLKQQEQQLKHQGADKGINTYVKKVEDSGIETEVKTFDEMVEFLDDYNDALTKGGPDLDKFVNTNKELLKVLELDDKVDKKHLENLVKKGKQYRENQIAIQHTTEEIASYNEEVDYQIDKLQAAKQMYLAVNKEMDSLQDAYKTIKGAQDEWNKEGYLTMDTVQSLIGLDNAYMSTLEVTANGIKMNEEAYVGVTQAKYASLAASIALQAQELINKYVTGELTASQLMEEMQMYASADASYSAADAALAEARATLAAKAANDEYAATIGNYLDAVEKKINLLKQAGSQVNTSNVGKVLGYSPKSSGGSKKSKETKDLKEYADEFDRFYPFQKVIDDLADAISDLAKEQEHLAGGELVGSIRYQNKLLQDQKKAYQELAKEQKKYQKEMQTDLAKYGMSFDTASGNIVNYAQSTQAMLDQYNAAIEKYNKSAQSDADKKTLEAVEKEYEKFKKLVSNYQGILTEIQDTENELDDIYYETIANNLKEFEIMVQVNLDIKEAERTVNDFINKINKNFKTVRKSTEEWMSVFDNALKNAHTYVDGEYSTISVDLDALNKVKSAIDSGDYGHEGAMFASETEAIMKYKELSEQLKDDAEDLYELYTDAWSEYLDAIDEAIESWEELLDEFDDINDTLDHYEKLIELVSGNGEEQKYNDLLAVYEQQAALHIKRIETVNTEINTLKETRAKLLAAGAKETDEDVKKLDETIKDGMNQILESLETATELARKSRDLKFDHENKEAMKQALGFDMDELSEQWNRAKKAEEGYYDENQRIYQLDKLRRKYNDVINDTKDIKLKQKLAEMRDTELKALEKKERLSEGDLEIAEKALEVEKAEIALKEAQDNKSTMRLQRDSQGNWSYQFVANEDDISNKQQSLMDASNELYETVKKNEKDLIESSITWWTEWGEARAAVNEKDYATREEYLKALDEVDKFYSQQILDRVDTLNGYKDRQAQATAVLLENSYQVDTDNYGNMTQNQKDLVDEMQKHHITDIAELVAADEEAYEKIRKKTEEVNREAIEWWDRLEEVCEINVDNMQKANEDFYNFFDDLLQEYERQINTLSDVAQLDLNNIGDAARALGDEIQNVTDKVQECVNRSDDLSRFRERLNEIEQAWYSVKDSITSALSELNSYLEKLRDVKEMQDVVKSNETAAGSYTGPTVDTGSSSGSGSGGSGGGAANEEKKINYPINSIIQEQSMSTGKPTYLVKVTSSSGVTRSVGNFTTFEAARSARNAWMSKKVLEFNTGGYTGSWSDTTSEVNNGKLAWLHQKELVLNQADTKNILDAVELVRNIKSNNSEFINYIVDSLNAGTAQMINTLEYGIRSIADRVAYTSDVMAQAAGTGSDNRSPLEQNVHIEASFPNVNSSFEIETALNNLVNVASQRANSDRLVF